MTENRQPLVVTKWIVLSLVATFTVIASMAAVYYRAPLGQMLHSTKHQQSEAKVELFFAEPQAIIKQLEVNATYDVPYKIVSHAPGQSEYPYEVWLKNMTTTSPDNMRQIEAGTIKLGAGAEVTQTATFSATEANTGYLLIIKLPSENREISVGLGT
jgi:hypothetical protein